MRTENNADFYFGGAVGYMGAALVDFVNGHSYSGFLIAAAAALFVALVFLWKATR